MAEEEKKPAEAKEKTPPDNPRRAAIALALAQVPWFVVLATQPIPVPLVAWNVTVSLGVLVLAAFAWNRAAWAAGPATVVGWYGTGFSAWWAIQVSTPILFASAALSMIGAACASSWQTTLPGNRPQRTTPKSPDQVGIWLRENVEAIIVAFVMALVIRCFCIEVFKIPSSSMEPTLLGDFQGDHVRSCYYPHYHGQRGNFGPPPRRTGGDRIMVSKYFYAFTPVKRYDVMVFKFPLNQARNFIKRVVGLPGEDLMISAGDIWTRPAGSDDHEAWTIARKPLRVQDAVWISEVEDYLDHPGSFDSHWVREGPGDHDVKDSALTTFQTSAGRDIRFIAKGAFDYVGDVRLSFSFEMTGPSGEIFADVTNGYGRFEAILSTKGPGALNFYPPNRVDKPPADTVEIPAISAGEVHELNLAVWDGRVLLRLDGREAASRVFLDKGDPVKLAATSREPTIAFGSRGVTFRARDLRLGRDLFYRGRANRGGLAEHEPITIPDEKYVVMGDNSRMSHDSRAWSLWTYRLKDGRVIQCEGQETSLNGMVGVREEVQEALGLEETPDLAIRADVHGRMHALSEEDVVEGWTQDPEPFRFIDRKFIVGRAFWVWWPQGRWFRLIK